MVCFDKNWPLKFKWYFKKCKDYLLRSGYLSEFICPPASVFKISARVSIKFGRSKKSYSFVKCHFFITIVCWSPNDIKKWKGTYEADFFLRGQIFPPYWPESSAKSWQSWQVHKRQNCWLLLQYRPHVLFHGVIIGD